MSALRQNDRHVVPVWSAVVLGIAATGIVAMPAPAQAHDTGRATGSGVRASAAPSGFTPVRTTAAPALTMTSPAPGEVWVAEKGADGKVVLEHKAGRRWSISRLPVTADSWDTRISGTASNDVWLTSGGTLWHWNGARWLRVRTFAGAKAVTVTDVPGPGAYVGLDDDGATTGYFRVTQHRNGSRPTWEAMGRPADVEGDYGPTWRPAELTVAGGEVWALFTKRPHSATFTQNAFSYGRGGWTDRYQAVFYGGGWGAPLSAWLVNPARHLLLGYTTPSGRAVSGWCRTWTPKGDANCTTGWAVGGAATRRDGSVVVGGIDQTPFNRPAVPAAFGVRELDGTERAIPGDPGDGTLEVVVEPGSDRAWALTRTGDVTTVQTWAG